MVKGFIRRVTFNICILSAVLMCSVVSSNAAFALTSQSSTGFQFSFNSSLSITLSSSDLIISHLTPGNYASSNTISVGVSTNNRTGYTLVAKVGDKTSSTLNNNNLVNTAGDANFTSLATTDNKVLANFDDGKWGYTIAPTIASATTYSGLLYNTDTIINATRNVAGDPQEGYLGSNSTSFTIGAKAGQAQASGEYTNVINFRGVANVVPDIVMQETNLSELATVMPNTGDTAMFVDNRDGNRYTVGKLADGKYWMTQNLDLAGGTTLTSADSNVSSNYTLPASSTSGFKVNNTANVYNSGSTTCGDNSPCYSYYSYAAATAGTNPSSGNATSDICPKGWRLPTIDEFITLMSSYSTGEALTAAPFYGVYAGDYFYGFNSGGTEGNYWSSTASSSGNANHIKFDSSLVKRIGNSKGIGVSVRCVFGSIMQNVTASDLAAMMPNAGNTATLMDSRDGKSYTIGKINGDYWMTQNLDLAGRTTLTPADSNVSSNYTLPASSTSGFSDDNTAYVYNSGSTTCGDNSPCYSYYSYMAATAGAGPSFGPATSDICPKGWRLPIDEENHNLTLSYTTGTTLTAAPWYGVYAGYYGDSSFYVGGTHGLYWSSISHGDEEASNMIFDSSSADWYTISRSSGLSVRCIFDFSMQNVTTSDLAVMMPNTGDTTTLRDSRDGKNYTIGKINGQYWMTQNLNLAGGTTLTPADSNVSSDYTLPASSTSGFDDDTKAYVYNSGRTTCGNNKPCYSYYSYVAATAGTNPSSGNATSDICPKGWRLPTDDEFETLLSSYSTGAALTTAPFYGVYTGSYLNGSFNGGSPTGNYWSSTVYNSTGACELVFTSSFANVDLAVRRLGYSVRCVAK